MAATAKKLREIDDLLDAKLTLRSGLCYFCKRPIEVLRWHHVDPATKEYEIGVLRKAGKLKLIIYELPKCEPAGERCHNNHHGKNLAGVECGAAKNENSVTFPLAPKT